MQSRRSVLAWGGPAVLLAGALVPVVRLPAAAILVAGWVLLVRARRPEAVAWAAVLPVALVLPWPAVLGVDAPLGPGACTDPLSVIAVRRLAVAVVGLAIVAALAVVHRSSRSELGLLRPSAREAGVALGAAALLVVLGLGIGPLLARPFFGQLDFTVPLAALVPATLFGVANGVLEEVQYRGAMQAWLGRVAGTWTAILVQGAIFGIVHAGPEVVALLPVHVALLGSAGVAAGVLRSRTGSLWLPIGIHVGADIALYVGLACRAAG